MSPRITTLLAAVLSITTGCQTLPTPEHFVELDGGEGTQFVTADDAKVWVRSFPVDEEGSLEFWCAAFVNETVEKRGYDLVEDNPVESNGLRGQELIFSTQVEGRPYRYLVTLYLRPGWFRNQVQVVEYLAEEETFAKHLASVRTARASLR